MLPYYSKSGGGVFQHALSIIDSLTAHSGKYHYKVLYYNKEDAEYISARGMGSVSLSPIHKKSIQEQMATLLNLFFDTKRPRSDRDNQVDLLISPFPSLYAYSKRLPYLVSIQDIMHKYYRDYPEFPIRERIRRDVVYGNAARHAALVAVDDAQTADDLERFYGVPRKKARVIPYIPPGYVYDYRQMTAERAREVLAKYNLPSDYIFYPAQFWCHKNHFRLVKALRAISDNRRLNIPLVLTGSPSGTYSKVMDLVDELDMKGQVTSLGYVSHEEIVALYKAAKALVFPSLFGPTNIPPLEAFLLGTPVVCSNLFSMPKQVGAAGLLFDPFDVNDISEKIYRVWTDDGLRLELRRKGYEKAENMDLRRYAGEWEKVIDEAMGLI
jgi:glycosyltransferase involved in cell wall biosynthesis